MEPLGANSCWHFAIILDQNAENIYVVKLGLEHFRFGTKERLHFYIHKYIQTIINSSLVQHDTLTLSTRIIHYL